jgi:hypothetical protein
MERHEISCCRRKTYTHWIRSDGGSSFVRNVGSYSYRLSSLQLTLAVVAVGKADRPLRGTSIPVKICETGGRSCSVR